MRIFYLIGAIFFGLMSLVADSTSIGTGIVAMGFIIASAMTYKK